MMKKLFYAVQGRWEDLMIRCFLLLLLFGWGSNRTWADETNEPALPAGATLSVALQDAEGSGTIEDPYVLQNEEDYAVQSGKTFYGRYTAEVDGTLSIEITGWFALFAADQNFENKKSMDRIFTNTGSTCTLNVKAGETYYLTNGNSMSNGTFRITMVAGGIPLQVTNVAPAAGSTFDVAGGGSVFVYLNMAVELDSVVIYTATGRAHAAYYPQGTSLSIATSAAYYALHDAGAFQVGDSLYLTLYGLHPTAEKDNLYQGHGKYTIAYVAGRMPVSLLSASKESGDEILSYYLPEDETGCLVYVFDAPLLDNTAVESTAGGCVAQLGYGIYDRTSGDSESSTYVTQNITPVIHGDSLIVPLQGVRRRPTDLIANQSLLGNYSETNPWTSISLIISGIKDAEGRSTQSNTSVGRGTLSYELKIKDLNYTVYSEFTPEAGKTIQAGDDMELWVYNPEAIVFEGISFSYTNGADSLTQVVSLDELHQETDEYGMTLTLKVPQLPEAADSTIVTVSPAGLKSCDGIDKRAQVTQSYLYVSGTSALRALTEQERSCPNEIYDLMGRKWQGIAEPAQQSLPRGLYIVNGQKKMIGK